MWLDKDYMLDWRTHTQHQQKYQVDLDFKKCEFMNKEELCIMHAVKLGETVRIKSTTALLKTE